MIDLERVFIYQKIFMKKCYFSLNYIPFDAEVAEKILNVI